MAEQRRGRLRPSVAMPRTGTSRTIVEVWVRTDKKPQNGVVRAWNSMNTAIASLPDWQGR